MSRASEYAAQASQILQNKAHAIAEGQRTTGAILGNTIATLGQVVPQQVQQAMQESAKRRQQQQMQQLAQQHAGDLDGYITALEAIDPPTALDLRTKKAAADKIIDERTKAERENKVKALTQFRDDLNTVKTPEDYTRLHYIYGQTYGPDAMKGVPTTYDPAFIEQIRNRTEQEIAALKPPQIVNMGVGGKTVRVGATGPAEVVAENPAVLTPDQQADNARMAQAEARQTTAQAEAARHNRAMEARPVSGGATAAPNDVKETIAGMMDGTLPPILPGRATKEYNALLAEAHRQGFNLSAAATDWLATQKHISTLNGAQQTRLRQAVDNAAHSLDVIEDLASKWQGGKFPILNKARVAAAKQGALGPNAQQIATALEAQIADVTSELANVYMGGNSPTDHALSLAAKNLSADWTEAQLKALIKQSRTNLQIRSNSIVNAGVAGASPTNQYAPQPTAPAGPQVGEQRTINGTPARWDGQGWLPVRK